MKRWTNVRKRIRRTWPLSSVCFDRYLPRTGSASAIHRDRFHASVAITEYAQLDTRSPSGMRSAYTPDFNPPIARS